MAASPPQNDWGEVALRVAERMGQRERAERVLHPELLRFTGRLREKRALDVGCGRGALVRVLASRGASVIGVDPSVERIEEARRLASEAGVQADFRVGELAKAKALPRGPFDLITAIAAFDPADKPVAPLRSLVRLMRQRGRLVLAFPHPYGAGGGEPVDRPLQSLFAAMREVGLRTADLGEPRAPDAPHERFLVLLCERRRKRS